MSAQTNILTRFEKENRDIFVSNLEKAIATGEECGFEVKSIPGYGVTNNWTANRIRLLAKNGESYLFYVSCENITNRKKMEIARDLENERIHLLMKTTGMCFFDYFVDTDTLKYSIYSGKDGIEKRTVADFAKTIDKNPVLHYQDTSSIVHVLNKGSESTASGELICRADPYGAGMRWYRFRYASVSAGSGSTNRIIGLAEDINILMEQNDNYTE